MITEPVAGQRLGIPAELMVYEHHSIGGWEEYLLVRNDSESDVKPWSIWVSFNPEDSFHYWHGETELDAADVYLDKALDVGADRVGKRAIQQFAVAYVPERSNPIFGLFA